MAPGLGCVMQDLQSSLRHTRSLVVACKLGCGFPDQGSNSYPLHWKHGVIATGPPGKSQSCFIWNNNDCPGIWVIPDQALWKDFLWPNLSFNSTRSLMVSWFCHRGVVTSPEPDTAQGITYWGRPHFANTASSVFCLSYLQGFLCP